MAPWAPESSLLLSLILAALVHAPAQNGASVSLHGQKGSVSDGVLTFETVAENQLDVPLDAVRVGLLYAASPEVLAKADPAHLYREGTDKGGAIGVVSELVRVQVPAHGEATLTLRVPLLPNGPEPQAFVTHVLGYGLGTVSAPLLLRLLSTEAAADEVAAVDALGLRADAPGRLAARVRLAKTPGLVSGLAGEVDAPVPERPTESDTFRRAYAVRALGVLGGKEATRALERLKQRGDLGRFDEPFQVLRIARLVGSPLETALAYTVPATCERLASLVDVALEDVAHLDEKATEAAAASPVLPPPPLPVATQAAELEPLAPDHGGLVTAVVSAGVGGALALGLARVARRREKKSEDKS